MIFDFSGNLSACLPTIYDWGCEIGWASYCNLKRLSYILFDNGFIDYPAIRLHIEDRLDEEEPIPAIQCLAAVEVRV
ncbi:MAG: hypothetical protein ABFS56_14170 [Pseudomonadota bacterium]